MTMTLEELKTKLFEISSSFRWKRICTFRDNYVYGESILNEGLSVYGYHTVDGRREYRKTVVTWEELTADELDLLEKFVVLRYPKEYKVVRERYLITFENVKTTEKLAVNLKDKKFTKTYATGKERDIKYPHTFFKGMDGRLVSSKIPADDNFKKLVDVIIRKESRCSNMGTFLVRLLDNIHLETYINADIKFRTDITVPYNFFDKDVRELLNKHGIVYDRTVEAFFANNHDLGKSMLSFIKDDPQFTTLFRSIASNMRDINILVDTYKYDVKRLFEYCKERNWSSNRYGTGYKDLVSFIADYARMADCVFPNGFEKYPKDIIDHHNGVTKLYEKEKIKFDDQKYTKMIDPKLEYEAKEFCMIFPKSTGDIQEEGRLLSHCVGSYVQRILDGNSVILFMRKKEEKDTPLVTVEVYNGRINQARGKYNRALSYDEKVFLQEYAQKKRLKSLGQY